MRAAATTVELPSCVIHFIAWAVVDAGVPGPPRGHRPIRGGQSRVVVDHVEQDADQDGDHEEHDDACREQEASGRLSIHSFPEEPLDAWMTPQRAADRLRFEGGIDGIDLDPPRCREPEGQQRRGDAAEQDDERNVHYAVAPTGGELSGRPEFVGGSDRAGARRR